MSDIKNILVTGTGGDIGQSVIKCLKDTSYELNLTGCDIDAYAACKDNVDSFFQAPRATEVEEYKAFIEKIISESKIDYIIPTTEAEIKFFGCHIEQIDKRVTVLMNKPKILGTFFDKLKTVEFLKDNDILCPRTYSIEEYDNEIGFPVLLKQRFGCGGKGMTIVDDSEELSFYKRRNKDMIVQEVIGEVDKEYTVGVFSTGDEIYTIAFHRYLGYGSLSKIARLIQDKELSLIAEKIARVAGLVGSFNIQFRKTDEGYVPFEVNPRLSSTVYIRHYFGFKDVEWWLDMHEGRKIEYVPKCTEGVGVRRLDEVFFDCKS